MDVMAVRPAHFSDGMDSESPASCFRVDPVIQTVLIARLWIS